MNTKSLALGARALTSCNRIPIALRNCLKALVALILPALFFCAPAQANDIEPGNEEYTAVETANAIVPDGDLSEWPAGLDKIVDPRFSIPKGSGDGGDLVVFEVLGGDYTGPEDQSSSLQIVWNGDNVYIGLVVTDEYHENAANSAWNGDSVQLMIANDARDVQVALYNYALGGVEDDLGEQSNIAADQPDLVAKLTKLMDGAYSFSDRWQFPKKRKPK